MDDAVIKAGVWGRSPHEKKGGSRGVSPLAYEVTLWFYEKRDAFHLALSWINESWTFVTFGSDNFQDEKSLGVSYAQVSGETLSKFITIAQFQSRYGSLFAPNLKF